MKIKLFDSELKVLEILWDNGETTAKQIAEILKKQVGWSKTTTYTVIKKCIDKKAVERREPNFVCHPLVTREEAQEFETTELINKMYGGATDRLIASLLDQRKLTPAEIRRLKDIVDHLK